MTFSSSGFSHIGHYRESNQDRFLNSDSLGLYAVADGLGGLPGGEVASTCVIDTLESFFSEQSQSGQTPANPAEWNQLWENLNQRLLEYAKQKGFSHPIATTLSLLYLNENIACWSHMGDTRIYRLRGNDLQRLTVDHTLLEEYRNSADAPDNEASEQNLRNSLTRCLGSDEDLVPDIQTDQIFPGDRYLICSDGVWSSLSNDLLKEIMTDGENSEAIVLNIEQESLKYGGQDNLSAVVVLAG